MTVLSALRRLRFESSTQAAQAVGVCQKSLARWERGVGMARAEHRERLEAVFGISWDDLFREADIQITARGRVRPYPWRHNGAQHTEEAIA